MFFADYIVTAKAYRENNVDKQQIIQMPIQLLESSSAFAQVYEPIRYYQDGNQKVKLYEKKDNVTAELVQILSQQLREAYPAYDYVYTPDYYLSLMQFHHVQRICYDPWEILVDKEKGRPLTVEWQLDEGFDAIRCSFGGWVSGLSMRVYQDDRCIEDRVLPDSGVQQYEFDTRGVKNLRIEFGVDGDQGEGTLHFVDGALTQVHAAS